MIVSEGKLRIRVLMWFLVSCEETPNDIAVLQTSESLQLRLW